MNGKKSTSPWAWVGIGCAIAFAGFVGFVAFIVFVVFGAMRASEPYETALSRARRDPRVIAALGAPVTAGFMVSGNINVQNNDGTASLAIPIKGPKQKATLHVAGTKTRGRWSYEQMIVTPASGPEIDLLPSTPESPRTAPPAD